MKVHGFGGGVVDLGFRSAQRFKNRDGCLLRLSGNVCPADDFPDFGQPTAVGMGFMGMIARVRMRVFVSAGFGMVIVRHRRLADEMLLSRRVLLALHPHIHFGCGNPCAPDPRNLQTCPNIQRGNRLFEQCWRHPSIKERAQKHVAADAGKTLNVGYAHGFG